MGENIRNATQTIGTTALEVVPTLQQGQRTVLSLINTSTSGQTISLSWGAEAIANSSVVLFPGGSWSESEDASFKPSIERVWAVASAAGGTLAIHERVKAGGR